MLGHPFKSNYFLGHKLLLAAADLLALAVAFYLSNALRNYFFAWRGGIYTPTVNHTVFFIGLCAAIFFYFRHNYLYRRLAFAASLEHLEILIRSWLAFVALFITISFFFKVRLFTEHRITVFLFIALGLFMLYLGRFIVAPAVARHLIQAGLWPSRTLFIGPAAEAHRLIQLLGDPTQATGNQLVACLDPEQNQVSFGDASAPPRPLDRSLSELIREHHISEVFIRLAHPDLDHLLRLYHELLPLGVRMRFSLSHFGALRDRVPVLPEVEHGYVFINASPLRPLEQQLKYGLDRLAGGLGLFVLSPLFALLALLIKLDSRGPVFFRQDRVGRGGRIFSVFKFRTMAENTEAEHKEAVRKLVEGDHAFIEAHSGQAGVLKVTNASKVTRLGSWLRRTSLDELPQLINVWKGDMSLVGPRPLPCYEVELFKPWQHTRHDMKPGITGFWQVFGRSAVSHVDTILMDIFYIMNWSMALDLRILARTVLVVLTSRGGK